MASVAAATLGEPAAPRRSRSALRETAVPVLESRAAVARAEDLLLGRAKEDDDTLDAVVASTSRHENDSHVRKLEHENTRLRERVRQLSPHSRCNNSRLVAASGATSDSEYDSHSEPEKGWGWMR